MACFEKHKYPDMALPCGLPDRLWYFKAFVKHHFEKFSDVHVLCWLRGGLQ